MIWLVPTAFEPALPAHCEPANDFLLRFSSTFHVCVPTSLAFASNALGILSITAWLFAQLPQIWKNYTLKSTSGLSIFFLVEWCLGDFSNLLGALFTHQASWQVTIGAYYVFVDVCLVLQWVWYEKLKHGRHLLRVRTTGEQSPNNERDGNMHQVIIEGVGPASGNASGETNTTTPRPIFRTPTFEREEAEKAWSSESSTPSGTKSFRSGPSSPFPSPSPRTMLMLACLIAMAQASPLTKPLAHSMQSERSADTHSTPLENAGTVLSWLSTVLYLGSRLPQIYKNWSRKSTAGLSPHLFLAAFCGNLFYSAAILTNPRAWSDMGPYGGGGWADEHGNDSAHWVGAALPFFLGAAGVLGLDATVGMQFFMYSDDDARLIVVEHERGLKWRWRRVSGWMRGWVPSIAESKVHERRSLLEHGDSHGEGYGAL